MPFTPDPHTPQPWHNSPATDTPLDTSHLGSAFTDLVTYTQQELVALATYLEDGSSPQVLTLTKPIVSTQQSSTYSFALGDQGTVVESTSAVPVTWTIPPHASVAYPVGASVEVFQYGAGQITIVGGAGVTLRSDGSKVHTAGQYATIGLRQRALNEWVLSGDLI